MTLTIYRTDRLYGRRLFQDLRQARDKSHAIGILSKLQSRHAENTRPFHREVERPGVTVLFFFDEISYISYVGYLTKS